MSTATMAPLRAMATDLDGTLLRSDRSVSERTRRAVLAAEDAGALVVVATGRPPRWIAPIVEQLGDRGLVVCANGAAVYDPGRHELVRTRCLAPEVLATLVDDVRRLHPSALVGVEQGDGFAIDESVLEADDALRGSWRLDGLRIGPIESFLDRPVLKLIVRLPPPARPGTATELQSLVGDRAKVTHSTDESFLELSHPDVHKAATVEHLLLDAGIAAAEVVAFGDMPNDLELIRWAGLGVAVANAHPLVLAEADEVTSSNDDDGVAVVLERLLGDGRLGA